MQRRSTATRLLFILCPLVLCGSLRARAQESSSLDESGLEDIAVHGCASCHDELSSAGNRVAPNLLVSVAGLRTEFVAAYIGSPKTAHPATRMPDMLHGLAEVERRETAAAIAAFLHGRSVEHSDDATFVEWPEGARERGEVTFQRVGCVQCHAVPGGNATRVTTLHDLAHVPEKYTRAGLAAFLLQPLIHRPAGLMPDMHLSRAEALDLASYLVPDAVAELASKGALGDLGARAFREHRCGSCHPDVEPADSPSVPIVSRSRDRGCLAAEPPAHAPDYAFDADERGELRVRMMEVNEARSDDDLLRRDLSAFRCYACHARDGAGGVASAREEFLHTEEPDLGDVARRPPDLTGVGAKIRRSWLERVLFDGASVRPYMATRMPVFGVENVAHLPELFESVDEPELLDFPELEGDAQGEAREAAREMLGTTSLGCVSCHKFNAKDGPSFQGIDLITTPERLHEHWFREFLIAPQKMLPGVVMPESWPGGVAVHDGLLGGDTDRQIAAIWNYLALGRSARDPRGIAEPPTFIDANDAPRVYRGRSRVAGFRGIAVGFPEGIHYAFDAQNGALSAIWTGEFVSVNWNGQGAGDFRPRGEPVEFTRDVALLERADQRDGWPRRPITTEEEPVNQDPRYPLQYGYRFRGYRIDEAGVPRLRYSLGGVDVSDRMVAVAGPAKGGEEGGRRALTRVVTFESREAVALTFRVAIGEIESLGGGRYLYDGALVVEMSEAPRLREAGEDQELLIDIELPAGITELELGYEIDA